MDQLIDTFGRRQETLRISVTDRCQMKCVYCLPNGSPPPLPRDSILSFEEISAIVRVAANLGVTRVRLTGGEPLLRRELHKLIAAIAKIRGIETIALTSNALLLKPALADLVAAGLTHLSISLDTLDRDDFEKITGLATLDTVTEAIESARSYAGLKVEINAVAIRGDTMKSICQLLEFSRTHSIPIRFIELMPFEGTDWKSENLLTGSEITGMIADIYGENSFVEIPRARHAAPARRFRFLDQSGGFGLIEPVSRPFCESCDRLRLSSDGMLYTCLFSRSGYDLRSPVRNGDLAEVDNLLKQAVIAKGPGGMLDLQSQLDNPPRIMASIGG